jgi:hypothetical protein
MTRLDLTDEEERAPIRLLQQRPDNDRFPFAPRPAGRDGVRGIWSSETRKAKAQ